MNLIYPTKDEIITFFKTHYGFISVISIAQSLVAFDHNNIQDVEWQHVRGFLHQLKASGYLHVQNEGADLYNEKFSATPDLIDKYFEKDKIIDNADLTDKSEEDLLAIIRRNENSHIPGSLHQRATQELGLRDRQKVISGSEKRQGLFLRVGGDMILDGSIEGPENGTVDIAVAGNYKSKKGKISQGKQILPKWWEKTWVQVIVVIGALASIIALVVIFK